MNHPLPPLLPLGIGTGLVESLTSYVRRMAALLRVTNFALIQWLAPGASAGGYTEAINGTERLGGQIVEALVRATGIAGIAQTSLFRARGLHLRRDFSRTRRWCPLCLEEDGYDPLVLALRTVEACPKHNVALIAKCENGHIQRTWGAWARPRQCGECGLPLAGKVHPHDDPSASAAASLIEWMQAGNTIEPPRVAAWMRDYRTERGLEECADHFGWVPNTVLNIESGAQRLRFSTVLRLVERADLTADDLHQLEPVVPAARASRRAQVVPLVDAPALRRAVRRELRKPVDARQSVMALASTLGVNHVTLRRHVPEVQILIDERRAARMARRA